MRDTRRGVLREAAVIALFLALAAVATRPIVFDLGRTMLAGPDPVIDLWTVHWLSGHLLDPARLFEGNVFHPVTHAAVYSDLSLGTAVLLLPFRAVLSDPVPLYNLAMLLALAFAAWSFHALARELTGDVTAGVLAGTLAGFGSHQLSHVYHLNLLSTGWLALLLLALHRLARRPGPGPVALAGVSFALAAQSCGYYAVAAAVLPLVFAAFHARELLRRRALVAVAAAAGIGALLLAPYLLAYLEVRERDSLRRPPGMSRNMAFQPSRDISSHGLLYREALGSDGERLFPGLLSLVLGGLAVARRRPGALHYAAAAALLLLLSLGPELRLGATSLALPYRALFAIPPLDGMRHPYTFAAVATMLLAVLAGVGWASLSFAEKPLARLLVVGLAVAETLAPAPDVREVPPGLPPAYAFATSLPPGALLEVPVAAPDALLWAARHGRPVVNGDGAFLPVRHGQLDRAMRVQWLRSVPEDVDDTRPTEMIQEEFPARYLIVPCGRQPSTCGLAGAMNRSRVFRLLKETDDGDRVYAINRSSEAPETPSTGTAPGR